MINKYTMNDRVLDVLRSIVEEEDIPVQIEEGEAYVDCHGDRLIDICLSYSPGAADTASDAMVRAVNIVVGILSEQ